MVEQRLARFKADRHARAVDFGQNIAGQPYLQVGILCAVQMLTSRSITHRRDIAVLCPVPLQLAFEPVREQAGPHRRPGYTDRQRIGFVPVARQCLERRFGAEHLWRPVGLGIVGRQRPKHRTPEIGGHHRTHAFFGGLKLIAAIPRKHFVRAVTR